MNIKFNSKDLEKIYLVILIGIMFFMGLSGIFQNQIAHDYPHGFFAADAFANLGHVNVAYDLGSYKHIPSYSAKGFTDVSIIYPPQMIELAASFAYNAGLETYDASAFLMFFMIILSSLITYVIIRRYSVRLAVLSTALFPLMFYGDFFTGFTWGKYGIITATPFLLAAYFFSYHIDLKNSWIPLGIFVSAVFLAHPPEAMFAVLFIAMIIGIRLLKKEMTLTAFKDYVFAGILTGILSLYYLIIFKNTLLVTQKSSYGLFDVVKTHSGYVTIQLSSFPTIFMSLILLGFAAYLIFIRKIKLAFIIGIFMLVIGYGNYVGLAERAFQTRIMWPIYFAVFFGLAISIGLKLLKIKWKLPYFMALALIIILLFSQSAYQKTTQTGIMTPAHWDSLKWISTETKADAEVFFFYADSYSQASQLTMAKRTPYFINLEEYGNAIMAKEIRQEFMSDSPISGSNIKLAHRTSPFTFGYYSDELKLNDAEVRNICNFDYMVFDTQTGIQQLQGFIIYNQIIMEEMLKNDWIKEVYNNGITVILKNNKPGEDCIEERKLNI